MPDNEVSSARFDVPASPVRNIYQITNFLGCDFTSSPSAVDENHSSNCVNMIRYQPGKVRKRMGYESIVKGTGNVFAIWKWDNNNYIVHIGVTMYLIGRNVSGDLDFTVISSDADTSYSKIIKDSSGTRLVFEAEKYHFIRSGQQGMIFGNGKLFFFEPALSADRFYTVATYPNIYVPTITISKAPDGGGTSYESFNLLSKKYTESFYVSSGDASKDTFHMSLYPLDDASEVVVQKMNSSGTWETVAPSAYTVTYSAGTIKFNTAPGQSPVEGEDSVKITVTKTIDGYYNRVAYCKFAIAYGISGNYDRIFISGNPDYPSYDWFSQKDDITYWPDTNYSVLGSDASPINGYAIVSNYLVTLKGDGSDRQTAIIRNGTLDSTGNPVFKVEKALQGYPIIAPDSSIMAGIEPMFLTREGIMAITTSDLSGDQIMNSRSYYLNGKLLSESHLEKAFAIRNGDFYMLFINSHVYILDTLQPVSSVNAPYSTRQYASFYWENVPATCAICIDEVVYFGTAEGNIMRFFTADNDLASYNDNGNAIVCYYDTADIDALVFFKVKTYRYFALRVFPAVASSVKIYAYKGGSWELIKHDTAIIRYFMFSQLVFSKFTFRADTGTRLVTSKTRLKKMDHVRFRVLNDAKNEPLMIDQFGIEYTQSNNVKN